MRKSTQRAVAPLFVAVNRTFGLKDRTARRKAAAQYYAGLAEFKAKHSVKRPKLVAWAERELDRTIKAHERTTKLAMPPVDLADSQAVIDATA